jgi:CheY-like chemotaxis protein
VAKILLIEDEVLVRTMFRDALVGVGHEVVEASDGEEGVRLFRAENPDVIITDLVMPHKGGLTAIKEIRAVDLQTPILAISGGSREGKLSFLRSAGTFPGVRTFQKPIPLDKLLEAVGEALKAR